MRSYPGIATRVLRGKTFRGPTSASFRSLSASTTTHCHVPAAAAAPAPAPATVAVRGRTAEGQLGALRQGFGEDAPRWGVVCAAAVGAAAVLGADGITDNNEVCDLLLLSLLQPGRLSSA